ncbi:MAG: hypothetical protein A3H42_00995 [Deltaproteobacteria bacterium RIFCSPLOWO2_02_FULL_46_8]|nr:MAG: hypothetical protein A3H42_00995 [Deltaproteobacteria bacterium RIFCSPLOWO2_02_FULL_46_8]
MQRQWIYLFKNKSFTLLFLSQAAASAGTWISYIAIPLALYQMTKDPVSIGILMLCRLLPPFILGPWIGWQIRKKSPEGIMILAALVHGIVFLGYLWANSVSIYYLLAVVIAVARAFSIPAKMSLIPKILPKENFSYANSAMAGADQVTMFMGPAIGGVLVSLFGSGTTITLCALLYMVSLLILLLLKVEKHSTSEKQIVSDPSGISFSAILAVWREIFSKKWLALLIVGDSFSAIAFGALNVIIPIAAQTAFSESPGAYGYFMSALGAGILLGTFSGPLLQNKIYSIPLYACSLLLGAFALFYFGSSNILWGSLVAILLVGCGNGVQDNTLITFLQKEEGQYADTAALFSTYQSFVSLCVMLAVVLASTLMKYLPPQQVLLWLSAIPLVIGITFLGVYFSERWGIRPRPQPVPH